MTARDVWEALGIELNKVQAPSLLIEDYNYFINKSIRQFINRSYNVYDMNLQTSDNLRVLKSTAFLEPIKTQVKGYTDYDTIDLYIYEVELPADYLHILNCIVTFVPEKTFKNYDCGVPVKIPATRLTSDMWSQVIVDAFNRPSYKRPYFFIHNVNSGITKPGLSPSLPTNPYNNGKGTDPVITVSDGKLKLSGLARLLQKLDAPYDKFEDLVNPLEAQRYGNSSAVRMELRFGKDDIFKPKLVLVDYLKTPQTIRLTQQQIETTEDTSQIMEFPDYVCQEIINGVVTLVMENTVNPRLANNALINQTIAPPPQVLQSTK